MTKADLEQYRHLVQELKSKKRKIEREEKRAASVPIIKDKVQSSMKEWPYLPMYETVEAPEARKHTAIQRRLYLLRIEEAAIEEKLLELETFISGIQDSRTRQIITYRYVDGHTLKDTAIQFDMTEQGILKIINKILGEFNPV